MEEIQMRKAYLYGAILLVNRGIDEAIRGLERLKRAKDSGLNPSYFDEKATLFEVQRAALSGYFCNNDESGENRDAARFEKRHREYEKNNLDEVQVYQDLLDVEERRRREGKPPKVRFFTEEEQRDWEQYPKPPSNIASQVQRRKGELG
jgi:hypothetical protein